MSNLCRVCGCDHLSPPWGEDGLSPSFEICACCGVEFGHEDYTQDSIVKYRKKWISNGASWFIKKHRPLNWDLEKQLNAIGVKL